MKANGTRFFLATLLAFGLCGMPEGGRAEIPATSAMFITRHLDVLSFPDSIHPRRRPGANLLSDYGFNQFKADGATVEATDSEGELFFSVTLVADEGARKLLCITDQIVNGTYLTVDPVEVELGDDGLFHGTGRAVEDPRCPEYRR